MSSANLAFFVANLGFAVLNVVTMLIMRRTWGQAQKAISLLQSTALMFASSAFPMVVREGEPEKC